MVALAQDPAELMDRFAREVSRRWEVPPDQRTFYGRLIQAQCGELLRLEPAQYLLVVDRSPSVQAAFVVFRAESGELQWVGATPVSTGRPGAPDHFITPLGCFRHTPAHPDFRAQGTRNEHGVRGYGVKGMRVFDFGWVVATRGWGRGGESQMRLQVHATDPDLLEPRLGVPLSKGCIRIPAALNRFLDHYGLLDADYDAALARGRRFSVLLPERAPVPNAGRWLVVLDGGGASSHQR